MYKTTSKNSQGRADRILMHDMPEAAVAMTDEQRRAMLNEQLQRLEMRLLALPRKHPDRKRLGQAKFLLQTEMTALRGSVKNRPNLGQCFIDAANRILPNELYSKIMAEAKHTHDIRYKADDERKRAQMEAIKAKHLESLGAP